MALTPTEESQTRALIAQEAPLLSLAGNEPIITSKLGSAKVNLSQLPAATVLADADIALVRQGTTDKSVALSVFKTYAAAVPASETAAGIVRLATDAETLAGILRTVAVDPGGLNAALASKIPKQIQSISASVASNALTLAYAGGLLDFRSATLTSGAPISNVAVAANSIVVPSGATLGTISGQSARLVLLEAYNGGSPVLCVSNLAGAAQLDETNLISPTTISSGATSASTIYSASTVSANSPYRVVGFVDATEATAGTWATAPTVVQGTGGQALASLSSLGYGQHWQDVTGSRAMGTNYYNTTGKPISVSVEATSTAATAMAITVNGVSVRGTLQSSPANTAGTIVVVPPGALYIATVDAGTPTLTRWMELR